MCQALPTHPFPPDPPKIGAHELILGIVAQNAPPSSLDYHMVYVRQECDLDPRLED